MNSSEKEIRKLMSELEFENETKNDLAIRLEEALQKLCAANIHDDISMNDKVNNQLYVKKYSDASKY